jgi:osmotically-inducible protein OsmY
MSVINVTDQELRTRDAVIRQLEWDPDVDASAIGVAADHGVVTLTGYIDTYAGKLAAERAAKGVRAVRAVANDIEVRPMLDRTDADIARDAVRALELGGVLPSTVQLTVKHRHITLTGKVRWVAQKRLAERAVRHVPGVIGVFNYIEVAPATVVCDVRHRITAALHRTASIDARRITVDVTGEVVTLTGTVSSILERETAERAAANAPGIAAVENRLVVEPEDQVDDMC